ncbi:MAG: NADH-quinone oxidoreductase subunit N [Candidatus Omnitrophica bacterium]|nr:NADH-quinone oxidoreductase subunit N [Candidatus Omnitrophota bacterium]
MKQGRGSCRAATPPAVLGLVGLRAGGGVPGSASPAEAILSLGGLLVLLIGAWARGHRPALTASWLTLAAGAAALWSAPVPPASSPFFGLILCDPFSLAFRWLALGTLAIVLLLASASRELAAAVRGECYGLLLLLGVGLMLMAEANHLLMAYLAMELVSLSSYVLVGFLRERRSAEAALKYLLFGALSSGIMLFGMSLLFGLTGSLAFPDLQAAVAGTGGPMARALLVAAALMLAGLAFKISMVPFHMWTPDVYEGAPAAVTALLSVGPKAAGLALLLRLLEALAPLWASLSPLLLALTVVTMTLGNLVALVQTNVKRLLAYSTIGQVGYLLIGLAVHTRVGHEALLVYLVAYLFMNLGAFACVVAVMNGTGSEALEAFRGLARRAPGLSLAFAVFLLSLAGIPPLLGFVGKFLLLGSALDAGEVALAVAAAVNSAIALYYYTNIIRLMYFAPPAQAEPLSPSPSPALRLALGSCAAATLALGLWPGPLLELISRLAVVRLL